MAPGGKALEDVGLDGEDHPRPGHAGPGDEGQGGPVPGAQVGDDQEGDEEDGGGAEVAHEGQAADTHQGEQQEEPQVPLPEEPVQGGGSGEDVADLGQLRGLEGEGAQDDPVHGAVAALAQAQSPQHQGDPQKPHGPPGHEPADGLHPVQVPEEDAQHHEEAQPQQQGDELLEEVLRGRRRAG